METSVLSMFRSNSPSLYFLACFFLFSHLIFLITSSLDLVGLYILLGFVVVVVVVVGGFVVVVVVVVGGFVVGVVVGGGFVVGVVVGGFVIGVGGFVIGVVDVVDVVDVMAFVINAFAVGVFIVSTWLDFFSGLVSSIGSFRLWVRRIIGVRDVDNRVVVRDVGISDFDCASGDKVSDVDVLITLGLGVGLFIASSSCLSWSSLMSFIVIKGFFDSLLNDTCRYSTSFEGVTMLISGFVINGVIFVSWLFSSSSFSCLHNNADDAPNIRLDDP